MASTGFRKMFLKTLDINHSCSFLGISGALHLGIFQHPVEQGFFSNLLMVQELDGGFGDRVFQWGDGPFGGREG